MKKIKLLIVSTLSLIMFSAVAQGGDNRTSIFVTEPGTMVKQIGGQKVVTITGQIDVNDLIDLKSSKVEDIDLRDAMIVEGARDGKLYDANQIPDYTFVRYVRLKRIVLPATLEKVSIGAFKNCFNLETVEFANDNKVDFLNNGRQFEGCEKLTKESIESIMDHLAAPILKSYFFSGCKALESITIPESIVTVSNNALTLCPNLKSITFKSKKTLKIFMGGQCLPQDFYISPAEYDFKGAPAAKAKTGDWVVYVQTDEQVEALSKVFRVVKKE